MLQQKKYFVHLIAVVLFIIASLAYFYPVLQGKKIYQSDIVQYTGMAKQQNDFRAKTGEETYWTDAAFGGMPTYQLGAKYPNNYIKKLDLTLRFLPRPADYLFLYFLSIYILLLIMKADFRLAVIGALAFGFSTYLIIILGVGHNAKAHAIAYMPLVIGGVILTLRQNYIKGFLLFTISMALEIMANHFQMTYYLLFLVMIIGIVNLVDSVKQKTIPKYLKAIGLMLIGVILALGMNATNLLATKEYADVSTRGKSELTIHPNGSPKIASDGLDYDYITEYSYGIVETFNLMVPRFMGGSTSEPFPENSETIETLYKMGVNQNDANQILNGITMYWGDQPIIAAPAYIGAVIVFLSVFALYFVRGKTRWWILSAFILSLLLSWGKNFSILTDLFIDNIPLYNKFRAVSSIQVIIEMVLPILAVIGLHNFFNAKNQIEDKKKALYWSGGITGGMLIIFLLFGSSLFDFSSPYDSYFIDELGMPFIDAVRDDRMALFTKDTIRSLVFILLCVGALWLYLRGKLNNNITMAILAVLIVVDLVGVDRRYVNDQAFRLAREVDQPFRKYDADKEILKDTDRFRVFDVTSNPFASGRASYFHNALGGYHAAKLGRIQDLDDFYLSKGNLNVLNMMNVKYLIGQIENGQVIHQENPTANGNVWYVGKVLLAENANEEIQLLDSLNTKNTAVILKNIRDRIPVESVDRDSTATIELVDHSPNKLIYSTQSKTKQLAVFSEIYYPNGWNAYIDNDPAEYFRANYVLRAMVIPEGEHKIEFKFEPKVIETGSKITLASSAIMFILLVGGIYLGFRKKERSEEISK
jgi:hypothetical protein